MFYYLVYNLKIDYIRDEQFNFLIMKVKFAAGSKQNMFEDMREKAIELVNQKLKQFSNENLDLLTGEKKNLKEDLSKYSHSAKQKVKK